MEERVKLKSRIARAHAFIVVIVVVIVVCCCQRHHVKVSFAIENEKVYWKLSAKNKDFSICIHHINRIFLRLQIGKPKQL